MKFVPIPPFELMEQFSRSHLFALAHLLRKPKYAQFFWKHARKTFSILDNGAYELNYPYTVGRLARIALEFQFSEIVLPDILGIGDESFQETMKALKDIYHLQPELHRSDVRFMLVPQGESVIKWVTNMTRLAEEHILLYGDRPFTIGVPKITKHLPGGRFHLVDKYLVPLREKFLFDIHLLGMGEKLSEVKLLAEVHGKNIRSIDSARPFVWAIYNEGISPLYEPETYYNRPEEYFTMKYTPEMKILAEQNVAAYERICLYHGGD